MNLVSKVDILLNENDDLAKKIADNSKEIKINFAALKNQIRLSKKKVEAPKRQIGSLRRGDINCRDARPRIIDHDGQVIRDRHFDEEKNPVNNIEDVNGDESEENESEQEVGPSPYPWHVAFILGNVVCERYSFYGMKSTLYLSQGQAYVR